MYSLEQYLVQRFTISTISEHVKTMLEVVAHALIR